jgi:hypothetical protein
MGAGALPLPTKQPPKLNPATTNASASATFFMEYSSYYELPKNHLETETASAEKPQCIIKPWMEPRKSGRELFEALGFLASADQAGLPFLKAAEG